MYLPKSVMFGFEKLQSEQQGNFYYRKKKKLTEKKKKKICFLALKLKKKSIFQLSVYLDKLNDFFLNSAPPILCKLKCSVKYLV